MIRPARPSDEPALAALQSHLDAPSPALLAAVVGDAPGVGADAAEDAAAADVAVDVGRCLVSVSGGGDEDAAADDGAADRPVGYALWIAAEDVHLAELVVHPDRRREGRGRALLRGLLARLESGARVTLFVAADNEPARALYESVGFRPVERRPDFYDEGEEGSTDAVVYAREV